MAHWMKEILLMNGFEIITRDDLRRVDVRFVEIIEYFDEDGPKGDKWMLFAKRGLAA